MDRPLIRATGRPRLVAGGAAGLPTVDVPAVPTVVGRRQEGKNFLNSGRRRIRPLRPWQEVHAVPGPGRDVVGTADGPDGDVGDVVVRPPTVGPARLVRAQ